MYGTFRLSFPTLDRSRGQARSGIQSVEKWLNGWIPAPRFHEDKFRGNDRGVGVTNGNLDKYSINVNILL